ncbi:MAG: hypothetical protein ACREFT_00925 [Acetobacteraceae bacterium]
MNNVVDFRYPLSQVVITYLLMPIVSLISLGLGVFLFAATSIFFGVILILFGVWLVFLSVFGSLMCSSVTVSNEGIAAHNFGRTLKFILWQDVMKVKKVRRWNAGSRSFENVFYIFDGTFPPLRERMVNLRGPIAFTDKIRELRELLDEINKAARRYHFPLVVLDQEAARKLATQTGVGAWRRTVLKVEEAPLTEL